MIMFIYKNYLNKKWLIYGILVYIILLNYTTFGIFFIVSTIKCYLKLQVFPSFQLYITNKWSKFDNLSIPLFSDWFPGWPEFGHYNKQPSDDGLSEQDCVEMRRSFLAPSSSLAGSVAPNLKFTPSLMWNDRDCSASNYYVCEVPKAGGRTIIDSNGILFPNWMARGAAETN